MAEEAAFGFLHDFFEVGGVEGLADDADGEAADELGLEAEVDEVAGGDLAEEGGVVFRGGLGEVGAEADGALLDALFDDLLQPGEGAGDDEEDVAGVDGVLAALAAAAHVHHGHHLAFHVHGVGDGNLGFLHELEGGWSARRGR